MRYLKDFSPVRRRAKSGENTRKQASALSVSSRKFWKTENVCFTDVLCALCKNRTNKHSFKDKTCPDGHTKSSLACEERALRKRNNQINIIKRYTWLCQRHQNYWARLNCTLTIYWDQGENQPNQDSKFWFEKKRPRGLLILPSKKMHTLDNVFAVYRFKREWLPLKLESQ